MAAHPIFCAIQYGGVWNDVTADVHAPSVLRVVRGAQDETGGLRPGKVELTLKDIDTTAPKYDPDHPLSPLYGIAGRNTQLVLAADAVTETFESATPVVTRTDAGTAFWTRSTTDAHTGTWSLKAGTVGNSQVSDVTLTTPANATACTFWYKVSSQDPGDGLQVLVDGVSLVINLAGITGWLQQTVKCLPGGTIRFRYTKDAAGSAGSDTAWIDDVHYYNPRNLVELSSWQPDQTLNYALGKGLRSTALVGEGVLRRIGRWKDPLRSPVYRNITARIASGRLLGYWPGEDAAGSSGLTNALPGGQPGLASNVSYGQGADVAGSDPLIKMTATSKLSGRFAAPAGSPNGWQISWALRLNVPAPSEQAMMTWTTSNGYRWYLYVNATQYHLQIIDADRVTLLVDIATGFAGTGDPAAQGVVFRVKVTATGGTVKVETAWYSQNFPTVFGITNTFTGTTGRLLSWASNGNAAMDGATFGQVYAVAGGTDDLQSYDVLNSFNGYRGEKAGDRFLRLCGYAGLVGLLIGNAADTQPMGPQKSDRLIDLLKEIQQTEDAPLFDMEWRTGLYMRTRQSMYHQTPKLTLTRAQCAPPLKKVTDDLVTGNQITVKNRTGGQATVAVTSGPGSTQDPPAGVGLYDLSIDVNVASDDDLDEIAGWYANKLADTSPRFPQVTIDFEAQPGLETAASLVQIGDRIVLSDVIPGVSTGLIVLGFSDVWNSRFERAITFVCGPDTLYNPAVYDDASKPKFDARTTTLGIARDAVQTAWTISTTDPNDRWSTAGTPYSWIVAGEVVTVTAMAAAIGSGPYTQTCTVTRGVNGIAKAHAVGEEIHIYPRARYAR